VANPGRPPSRLLQNSLPNAEGIQIYNCRGLRQGSVSSPQVNQRSNCPGPDIWYGVGEWGLANLQLSDGGKGYKLADGDPIPDSLA
jgi:hypothetical protein